MSKRRTLKRLTSRLGLGDLAADAIAKLTGNGHLQDRQREDLQSIEKQTGSDLAHFDWTRCPKTVLAGVGSPAMIAQESVILKAFHNAGYAPCIHLPHGSLAKKTYKLFGIGNFIHNDQLESSVSRDTTRCLVANLRELDDILALDYLGVRVGKYALSSLMRRTRLGSLDFSSSEQMSQFEELLHESMAATQRNQDLLDRVSPSFVMMVDRGYTPSGQLFDLCIKREIPVITWNAAHKNNHYILKRYHANNQGDHPCALSDQSWSAIRSIPWDDKHKEQTLSEISSCYQSGEWYGEVGTQFGTSLKTREELFSQLDLDSEKKTAIVFSHIFWDATFFWGEDLFDDYKVWFEETAKAAVKNDSINWIFKVHPANLTKNRRDNVDTEPAELQVIRNVTGGTLPEHIKLLDTDCGISTYSLFPIMDYCLTVRGTIGIESAAFGSRVLTAGTGRYDGKGFTTDFESKEAYLEALAKIETLDKAAETEIELAQRFAYATFIARPLRLEAITFEYLKTDDARLSITINAQSHLEFSESKDVLEIGQWLRSDDDDCMGPISTLV